MMSIHRLQQTAAAMLVSGSSLSLSAAAAELSRSALGGRLLVIWIAALILLGVALIDGKLWKVILEQRRHNKAVEQLLAEIRDRCGGPGA
jgi:hypothetical protein